MSRKDLEAALREGGEKVSEGRFRIDAARALQRLRDFRFADPAHWVLEVLRAAVASGAKRVQVRTDADDVEVSFDGRAFPPDAMKELLDRALNPGTTKDDQRARLLALGVAGALGVDAAFVKVASGGVALTLAPPDRVDVDGEGEHVRGTTLHLHKAFGWRVAASFVRGAPEAAAIKERCRRFPIDLVLNGEDVRGGKTASERTAKGDGWTVSATVPRGEPLGHSTIALDVLGVMVAERYVILPGAQVEAWVRADDMRRNASGSDVVDDDPLWLAARAGLEELSLQLLEAQVRSLGDDSRARRPLVARLLDPDVRDATKRVLVEAPLIPGPAGEWWSLAQLEAAVQNGPLHVAKQPYGRGSYPAPTVLLTPGAPWEALLPKAKRVDVAELVKRKARIAENREKLAAMPLETPVLADRDWVAKAAISATGVEGMLGFERGAAGGAFVRVLHHGRLLQAGELPALHPLKLRAVVDYRRPIADALFVEVPSAKINGLVSSFVEDAALRAVCDGLAEPAVAPHALDLLFRLTVLDGKEFADLPVRLRASALIACLGGEPVSLDTLWKEPTWQYVTAPSPHGLLDGSRVLLLNPGTEAILKTLAPKKLEPVNNRLAQELLIRRRLAEAKDEPRVRNAVVTVPVEGPDFRGEVGVPYPAGTRLSLTLLRNGFTLETTELAARFHHAVAAVDCATLVPNSRWTGAVRDAAFEQVVAAVNAGQRKLVAELVRDARRLDQREPGAQVFLVSFIRKELMPLDVARLDEVQRAVAEAKLFDGVHGAVSLLDLHEAHARTGRFWVLPKRTGAVEAPAELLIIREHPGTSEVLAAALGAKPEDPAPELARLAGLRRLEAWPRVDFALPAGVPFQCGFVKGGYRVLAGLGPGLDATADVHVLITQRSFTKKRFASPVPLVLLADSDTLEPRALRNLSPTDDDEIAALVRLGALAVVKSALTRASTPDARRALLSALARMPARELSDEDREALEREPLYPCTDGKLRDARSLDGESPLQIVSRPMAGVLPGGRPIVVTADEATAVGVQRWRQRVDVERELQAQNAALAEREKVARVERVAVRGESPWRQVIDEDGVTGEVVLLPASGGRLELYLDHKPLCVVEAALPAPLAAAANSDRLTPKPGFSGVVSDAELERVVQAVTNAAHVLAAGIGERHGKGAVLADAPRPLVDLAFLVASKSAWEWKGKKKGKGKKKAAETTKAHSWNPLLEVRLLATADGGALSLAELLDRQRLLGEVEYSTQRGRALEPGRVVWLPRHDELARAGALGVVLKDVTSVIEAAESVRSRPRVTEVRVPVASEWREAVTGSGLEGEVVLGDAPDGTLIVEVLHDRAPIERWISKHPIGGMAWVNSNALTPDAAWRSVKRNQAFKNLLSGVEAALERLVVRRLGGKGARAWGIAALDWKTAQAGPLGAAISSLELFTDLEGKPVTVGTVLAQSSRERRVQIARPAPGAKGLVLADTLATREVLGRLGVDFEDITAELAKAEDLRRSLTERRLSSLAWTGRAIVKRPLATGALRGELALSADAGERGAPMLARDGIAVCPFADAAPGVVGVIDVKDLAVNEDWTVATLTNVQRAALRGEIDQLFLSLRDVAPGLGDVERGAAATHVLRYLSSLGVEAPAHLDRLNGSARELQELVLFRTIGGELVTLQALAAEALARDKVAVMHARVIAPDVGEALVLEAERWEAPWLAALEGVLGRSRVWRVTELSEWKRLRAEADPPEGSPELAGLRMLRREVRLLRAGALGHLTPDDLEDVRLHRAGGAAAMRYDAKRKLVLLDPGHELIGRALREAKDRPERIWVLVAAMFGLVNRALEHVTDAHEAKLVAALAGHLAANPKLLER